MVENIGADRVKRMMENDGTLTVVDALGPDSFRERHLPEAVNVPSGAPNEDELVRQKLPDDKSAPIIVYCADIKCQASPTLSRKLEQKYGYTNVYDFEEGLAGWRNAGERFELPERGARTD